MRLKLIVAACSVLAIVIIALAVWSIPRVEAQSREMKEVVFTESVETLTREFGDPLSVTGPSTDDESECEWRLTGMWDVGNRDLEPVLGQLRDIAVEETGWMVTITEGGMMSVEAVATFPIWLWATTNEEGIFGFSVMDTC